jgi:hypothetical protein
MTARTGDIMEERQAIRPALGFVTRQMVWVGIVLAALSAVLVGLTVVRAPQMSPFDEWTHADYSWRLVHGGIPAAGTPVAPEILQQLACRGVAGYTLHLPPCDQVDPSPAAFPSRGEDYNFGHPPLYYGITGGLAALADMVVPGQHFFVLARAVGLLWLWAAMLVLLLAVRAFGAPWRYGALGAALLPLLPGVLRACSTVNNDAAAPLAGALALLVLARYFVQKKTGWLFPTICAFLIAGTKVINSIPILIVAVAFVVVAVLRWRSGERAAARSMALVGCGILAATLVVYEGWALFQAGRGDPNWLSPVAGVSDRPVVGMPFRELTSTFLSGLSPESGYVLPDSVNSQTMVLWGRALDVAIVAAPLMLMVAWDRRSIGWLVGAITFAGLAAYPLIVELQVYLHSGSYFPRINPRYGMSMEPWAVVALVLVAWKRGAFRLALAGIGAGTVAMVASVTGLV